MITKLRDLRLWIVLLGLVFLGNLIAGWIKNRSDLEAKLASIDQQLEVIQGQLLAERENYSQIREELKRTREQFCEAVSTGECSAKP